MSRATQPFVNSSLTTRYDPSKTAQVVRQYRAETRRKLEEIRKAIVKAIDQRDVFGLRRGLMLHAEVPPEKSWSLLDLPGKNKAFAKWIGETMKKYFLEDVGAGDQTPAWIQKYIRGAYGKGAADALAKMSKEERHLAQLSVQNLINTPFHRERIGQLFDRNFTELQGFSHSMSTNLQRIVADGLMKGDNPKAMARALSQRVGVDRARAERIVRTEVIRTNAEAQLNTFDRFGRKEVQLDAEWITAGDDSVCPECDAMAGQIFSIDEARGLIPLHPNCRCSWIPVQNEK
jgi:SPP1 gp7 family putative phage head morphogenesis protein